MREIIIIGSGFSSLSAACYLAKNGNKVRVLEKNSSLGGRARQLKKDGFTFDMGPSWYWMPDVFDDFFNDFGRSVSDYYKLERLSPGYQVLFGKNESFAIEDNISKIAEKFEDIEEGSGIKLEKFIESAKINYEIAVKDLVFRPGFSPFELVTKKTIKKINLFLTNIRAQVEKKFKDPRLRSILQFPVLFLGAKPENTPAFYNFMNYADFGLGTWHPEGGMYEIVKAMVKLGKSLGVEYSTSSNIQEIIVEDAKVKGVVTNKKTIRCDIVISGADYNHSEKKIIKNIWHPIPRRSHIKSKAIFF